MSGNNGPGAVDEFLGLVQSAERGWSDQFGGPEGVARHCDRLFDEIRAVQARISDIRAAAVAEMLPTHSGFEVASALWVSKSAISKIKRREHAELVW